MHHVSSREVEPSPLYLMKATANRRSTNGHVFFRSLSRDLNRWPSESLLTALPMMPNSYLPYWGKNSISEDFAIVLNMATHIFPLRKGHRQLIWAAEEDLLCLWSPQQPSRQHFILWMRKLKLRNTCWKSTSHSNPLDKPLSLLSIPVFLLNIRKRTHGLLYLHFTGWSGFYGLTLVLSFQSCGIPGLGLEAWHSDDSCSLSSLWLNLIYTCTLFISGTWITCAFLDIARGQQPLAARCLSVTCLGSTETPRTANL